MEQKDIVFDKGIHREPSVSLSDAELSECVNLMPSHGELVNMKPAVCIGTITEYEKLMCIHETSEYKHYIVHDTNNNYLYYYKESTINTSSGTRQYQIGSSAIGQGLKQIVAVGNALALIYNQSANIPMKYLLWKNGSYTLLEDMPDVRLNFSLSGEYHQETYTNSVSFVTNDQSQYPIEICTLSNTDDSNTIELANDTDNTFADHNLSANVDYYIYNNSDIIIVIYNSQSYPIKMMNPQTGFYIRFGSEYMKIAPAVLLTDSHVDISVIIRGKSSTSSTTTKVLESTLENYTAMMGDVKSYINKVYTSKNKFIFPFFVRYGVKLFDGSYCHISEPVLMLPNTEIAPVMINTGSKTVTCASFIADLYAKISLSDDKLNKWKDIITGVTIAISNPIYRINLGEEWDQYKAQGDIKSFSESSLSGYYGWSDGDYKGLWKEGVKNISSANLLYFPPSYTKEQYIDNVKSTSVFYVVKTLSPEDLKNNQSIKIDFSSVKLDNISTLPVLPDDYNSSNKFYPSGAFAYNNRLNVFDIKETLYNPYNSCSPINTSYSDDKYICLFYVSNMGSEVVVSTGECVGHPGSVKWIYYGNVNTTRCRILHKSSGNYYYCDIAMAKHPWLNGSYAYVNSITLTSVNSGYYTPYTAASSGVIRNNNAIYASNASNPFFFAVDNQNLIGTGKINAVSTAAKALSQGQFGQFPLYAFTDDGIWSLSVDSNGKYSTSNPVNRDVVTNIKSICQIDDSVIYACSQGLKQLAGSDAKLLTESISGHNVSEAQFLNSSSGVDSNHERLFVDDTDSINKMIENCMVMYDPSGKRLLHVYPYISNGKHYVYDMDNEQWSTEVSDDSDVVAIVPGYPYSTFQVADDADNNVLKQYTNAESNTTVRYGLLLTREYAAGDPFAMKMLHDLRLIYSNNNNNSNVKCKIAVFVSNDRKTWKKLNSLRRHSYKWYRFRIQTALTDLDALTSLSLRIEDRRTNKMR